MEQLSRKRLENHLSNKVQALVLWTLVDGRAYTAVELTEYARCSETEMTAAINVLLDVGILVKETHRHHYYRILNQPFCEELKTLLMPKMRGRNKRYSDQSQQSELSYCRSCHGHLAGWVGRRVAEQLQFKNYLVKHRVGEKYEFELTPEGEVFFTALGDRSGRLTA